VHLSKSWPLNSRRLCLAEGNLGFADNGCMHPGDHGALLPVEDLGIRPDPLLKVFAEVWLEGVRDVHELCNSLAPTVSSRIDAQSFSSRHEVARRCRLVASLESYAHPHRVPGALCVCEWLLVDVRALVRQRIVQGNVTRV